MFTWISNNIGGPAILIFIGALISATGAIWAARQQIASERELKQKNEEITELSKQISYSITGGDSFCYLAFQLPENCSNNNAMAVIVHKGEYPLYDVGIRIVDLAKFARYVKGKEKLSFEDTQKAEKSIKIGNISPSQATFLGKWSLPQANDANYNVFISARNGFFTELIRIKCIDDKWVSAYKVDTGPGKETKLLYEKIHEDFPKNKEGKIDW